MFNFYDVQTIIITILCYYIFVNTVYTQCLYSIVYQIMYTISIYNEYIKRMLMLIDNNLRIKIFTLIALCG